MQTANEEKVPKMYVNRKSELSLLGQVFERIGCRCYRVRTRCGCTGWDNSRHGLIVIHGDTVRLEIIRCKACAK